MNYYIVTNSRNKVSMLCREDSEKQAKYLYKAVVNISGLCTRVHNADHLSYIPLNEYEYILYSDEQKMVDFFELLDSYKFSINCLKKDIAERRLTIKLLQEQVARLYQEVENQNNASVAKSENETVAEKVKEATAKKVVIK